MAKTHDERDRRSGGREDEAEDVRDAATKTNGEAIHSEEELRRPQLQVGAGDLGREARVEVLPLDHARQAGDDRPSPSRRRRPRRRPARARSAPGGRRRRPIRRSWRCPTAMTRTASAARPAIRNGSMPMSRDSLERRAEDVRRQVDPGHLELLDELGADPGRPQPALDLALDDRRSARRRRCPA